MVSTFGLSALKTGADLGCRIPQLAKMLSGWQGASSIRARLVERAAVRLWEARKPQITPKLLQMPFEVTIGIGLFGTVVHREA